MNDYTKKMTAIFFVFFYNAIGGLYYEIFETKKKYWGSVYWKVNAK